MESELESKNKIMFENPLESSKKEPILLMVRAVNIIKGILSFLTEKEKLLLLKYNNTTLKKLNIGIESYKKISGRECFGEINGYGVEYNLDTYSLLYEGYYLHGKRNGKGKEYNKNGDLIFDGEYLNGKRWEGKGKEYDKSGNLIFEGGYLDGKRSGEGKEYYNDKKIKFEGEYFKGQRWNGKEYIYKQELIDKEFDSTHSLIFKRLFFGLGKGIVNDPIKEEFEYLNGEKKNKEKKDNSENELKYEEKNLNEKKTYEGNIKNGIGKELFE